jgi:predicted transposase/invertase (TIGR01784 family)
MTTLNHPIDPLVDYAFKRLFANPEHLGVLVAFLNAVLQPKVRIAEVTLVPTESGRAAKDDRAVVVDVLAEDERGTVFHVEMQRRRHAGLEERVVYSWARLLSRQLLEGEKFHELAPVFSVWVLEKPLARDLTQGIERFAVVNERGRGLRPHGTIVLVQPSRFRAEVGRPLADWEAWLYYLKHAPRMQELPAALAPFPVMHEVMEIMSTIANNLAEFAAYHRRLDAKRIEQALALTEEELRRSNEDARKAAAEARKAADEATRREEAERQAKEAALAQAEAALAQAEALARELAELRAKLGEG